MRAQKMCVIQGRDMYVIKLEQSQVAVGFTTTLDFLFCNKEK